MDAAWAAQADSLTASMGKICRHLALIVGWVPHALYEPVIWVRQQLFALGIEGYTCNNQQINTLAGMQECNPKEIRLCGGSVSSQEFLRSGASPQSNGEVQITGFR